MRQIGFALGLAACTFSSAACAQSAGDTAGSLQAAKSTPTNTATSTTAKKATSGEAQAIIEAVASEFLADGSLEMVSIGVTWRGTALTQHSGPLYRESVTTADDTTIFEARSISKSLTGTLAGQAVLDGKLALNLDIRTYLDADLPNLEVEGSPILLRHLLTHTSGLPSNNPGMTAALEGLESGDAAGARWREVQAAELAMTKEGFLANLHDFRLTAKPGTQFNYSNLGTNLTAHILERVYERPFAELVNEAILAPAGMDQSGLAIRDEEQLSRLANGYNELGEATPAWPVWPMWGAEGALKATVPDMVRYMQFSMDSKNAASKLSQVPLHRLAPDYQIGFFWWVIDVGENGQSFRHDGGSPNVRNVMILYPDDDLGIYVVTNRVNPEATNTLTTLTYRLRRALLDSANG